MATDDPLLQAPAGRCPRHEEKVHAESDTRLCGCALEPTASPRAARGGLPTWAPELSVVLAILSGVMIMTGAPAVEWIAAAGVLASFAHGQVADRLAEREAAREQPDVDCHAMARRYYVLKELLWFAYFVSRGAWAALVGCVVFIAYPAWRQLWRRHYPLERTRP